MCAANLGNCYVLTRNCIEMYCFIQIYDNEKGHLKKYQSNPFHKIEITYKDLGKKELYITES